MRPPSAANTPSNTSAQGDGFTALEPIAAGSTTTAAPTRTTSTCTIREKDLPAGVQVSYSLVNTGSGAQLTDAGNGTATLKFADNSTKVEVKATNTFTKPSFAVEKTGTDGPAEITSNTNSLVRNYQVKVTNKGKAEATSPAVTDTPGRPEGFTISKVLVDDVQVPAAGSSYQVTAGDKLAPNASQTHKVQVTYAVVPSKITEAGMAALGQCAATGPAPDPAKGIYNVVKMEGDVDGIDNNDACTTATDKRGTLTWNKVDTNGGKLAASSWTLTGPKEPAAGVVVADCVKGPCASGPFKDEDPAEGQFKVSGLAPGQYSIQEKDAPRGFKPLEGTLDFEEITAAKPDAVLKAAEGKVRENGVINHRQEGSVTWNKVDAANRKPLSSSVWELSGPQVPADTKVSDCVAAPCEVGAYKDADPQPGAFRLTGLGLGEYRLVEAAAPAGYKLDKTPRPFELSAAKPDYQFAEAFTNEKTAVPFLPLTGGLGADSFLIGGGSLAVTALAFGLWVRRRCEGAATA
ncbi:Predicted outer membrane protein [Actinomyces bovis]|uniref:Predicted outer membrane protein n=1 Tax=Actinomyces bovis TaxID=1658 RepID=A0ABY1VN71_9ACTO|nr:SpaA isopeptide-forming pilin-related protein [Actinomyces bovis]SPT52917.1 Predicted outer membrane protein [Actinomyces bovis]VEG55073.1 Predicted outer membrane protein [Actinomyces israelii]